MHLLRLTLMLLLHSSYMHHYYLSLLFMYLALSYLSSLLMSHNFTHFTPNLLHIMYVLHLMLLIMSLYYCNFNYPIYIHLHLRSYLSLLDSMLRFRSSMPLDFNLYYMLDSLYPLLSLHLSLSLLGYSLYPLLYSLVM